jgi:hypothetical protein
MAVNVHCITSSCKEIATVTTGKNRLNFRCPSCGPLNFQTKAGQITIANWVKSHSIDDENAEPLESPSASELARAGKSKEKPTKKPRKLALSLNLLGVKHG